MRTPGLEAAALFEPDALPVILLNKGLERVRVISSRRAILAHELCHLLHDAHDSLVTSLTGRTSTYYREAVEKRANGFAPAYLAPRGQLLSRGGHYDALMRSLIVKWGFSLEGAAWHTKNTLLKKDEDVSAWMTQFADLRPAAMPEDLVRSEGLRAAEGSELLMGLVGELVVRARSEGLVSNGRAVEILRTG